MQIIMISGKAGSGKSFLATHLKEYLEEIYGLKGYIINFGDPLKMVATQLYGWDGEKGERGRKLLQVVGTDIAQKNNKMVWVRIVTEIIEAFRSEYDFVIIGDVRFLHEINGIYDYFLECFDSIYHITIVGRENTLSDEAKNHPSETEVDQIYSKGSDFIFNNKQYSLYRFIYQLQLFTRDIMRLEVKCNGLI